MKVKIVVLLTVLALCSACCEHPLRATVDRIEGHSAIIEVIVDGQDAEFYVIPAGDLTEGQRLSVYVTDDVVTVLR